VIAPAFEYERAESLDHAVELLSKYGPDAKPLAGGQSLLSFLKLRLARPTALVDIGRLTGLNYIREEGDKIAIGALTTYTEAHHNDLLRRECPIVSHACGEVGDPQVRHVGTIGGGVAHGDPASDVSTVLVALDAVLTTSTGRTIPAQDFFKGPFEVDLNPDELLTEIQVPKTADRGWSYVKFHPRAQDWAIVGVAAITQNGSAAVALTNMGGTPIRATAVEEAVSAGEPPESAAQRATEGTSPVDDAFAGSDYRRYLAPVLTRRALEEARSR
jgi:carbon-monoxide dehydrogenase medium subunit